MNESGSAPRLGSGPVRISLGSGWVGPDFFFLGLIKALIISKIKHHITYMYDNRCVTCVCTASLKKQTGTEVEWTGLAGKTCF